MGLGLSIVRDIITTINGKIWYETSASNGTSFYVEIPRYEASPKTENNHT
jgi:K+-sensing histidine kinase KdpD